MGTGLEIPAGAALGGTAGTALGNTAMLAPLASAINTSPLLTGMGAGGLLGGGVTTQGLGAGIGTMAGGAGGATLSGLLGGQGGAMPPPPAPVSTSPMGASMQMPGAMGQGIVSSRPPMGPEQFLRQLGLR